LADRFGIKQAGKEGSMNVAAGLVPSFGDSFDTVFVAARSGPGLIA
jgi:hypothetical protein